MRENSIYGFPKELGVAKMILLEVAKIVEMILDLFESDVGFLSYFHASREFGFRCPGILWLTPFLISVSVLFLYSESDYTFISFGTRKKNPKLFRCLCVKEKKKRSKIKRQD
uniref:Uncharacterized protein n=1 Tax=Cacopsylla melanoneura TaxID=428564 RepID=A0A8D8ZDB2_9HEMI